ncbi:uncharacterized protein C8Q71DRAFT_760870 [Rhodofomes roseus]|uniref:MYND-type domain-containing protein n=1 Tax=Rhodofomes roseus TaxID=34475 RepID=A0ABQ8KET5_9APHY|nr:uncharacterized protein C8Q71DRAFT_760870 [Rhodofomes roseus]KAH9836148.1 hypothetical protein C8Q71DRAFT_760870 [Rhodofomes roseus]
MRLSMDNRVNLMICCNGVATCLDGMHKETEALEWYEEVDILYKNARFAARPALHDWEHYNPQPPRQDFYMQRIRALVGVADMYVHLGNTGAAAHRRSTADALIKHAPAGVNTRALRVLCPIYLLNAVTQFRHPDPELLKQWEPLNEDLQVRGSWQRMKISRNILPRMSFASFIWQSRLYICGGMKGGSPEVYNDFHCMDLSRQPGTWRELPRFPRKVCVNLQLVVHGNKAYCFRGAARIDYFNLTTERWGSVLTRCVDRAGEPVSWPIPDGTLSSYAMHVADGRMYVFGGAAKGADLGCNFFAVLDLSTKTWQHLSGVARMPEADPDEPGPRRYVASWVDGRKENVYLLQGMADRAAAEMFDQAHVACNSHGYDDFWSWNIEERKWRREKMVGNVPCPRTEMASTYSPALNSAIVYGGYSPETPTLFADSDLRFRFTYYADTFVLDHSSASPAPRWRHVVHQGFPTYRAQSTLLADPDTGRVYLFGGYTNTDQVPSGNHGQLWTRSFGDLWQLRLDVPGGHFEEVDVADEERNARLGPWQRCFSCGNTGMWRKCGGTCGGRAFFCDDACQREAWREHKELHNCRKR